MLKRKMFRDIRKNLSQFITIFLMIMIGIMAYSGIEAYMDGMTKTANKFYSENNLQDLDVMGYLNHDDLDRVKKINNVNDAELKLSVSATTDNDKILLLNFIESNNISKFYIIDGEEFDVNKSGVWLDEFYAKENNIKIGDMIKFKYDTLELIKDIRHNVKTSSMGSVAHACMLLASGVINGVIFPGTQHAECDTAASKLIVEEAGGITCNFKGNNQRYDEDLDGFIATNKEMHEELMNKIKEVYK